ncbi:MAG: hypothetical protein ACJAVK_002622 [Akkermansiaceae bacterium]|jgi:hypothetical protein
MKSTIVVLITLTTFLATIVTRSQTPTEDFDPLGEMQTDLPRMIRVYAEFIEMSHPTYTGLMTAPRTSTNDSDLRAQCAKLIEAGEARMIESVSVTALPGQSATAESIAEYIYPTESEPPVLPNKIGTGQAPTLPFPKVLGSPPTPSAFDTKNTGTTLEVEAQIDANNPIVELRLTPTIVYLADTRVVGTWKNEESTVETSLPLFYVLSTKTGATLVAGEPQMIGVHSPHNENGLMDPSRKIMLFVRADIIHVGK